MQLRLAAFVKALKYAAIGFGWILLILLIGFVISSFPTKVVVVLIAGCGVMGVTLFAWLFRSNNNPSPGRPYLWCLLLVVALSVIWPRYVFAFLGGTGVNPLTLSTVAGTGIILLWFLFSPTFSKRLAAAWAMGGALRWLILLWLGWSTLANIGGEHPVASMVLHLHELVYLGSFCLFGCVILTYESGPRLTLKVLVFATLFVSFAGVIEALVHKNYFVKFAPAGGTKDASDALTSITMDKTRGGAFRIQSTFDHPIVCAQYLGAMLPILYHFVRFEKETFWRWVALLAIPLSLVATIKTGSRAGLVGIAVGAAAVGFVQWMRALMQGRMSRMIAVVALPALLMSAAVGYTVFKEYALGQSGAEYGSTQVRLHMLYMGISALTDSPIWGFGSGMSGVKAGVVNPEGLATIDNYFLSLSVDFGYVGLILILLLIFTYLIKGFIASVRLLDEDGFLIGAYAASVLTLMTVFTILSIPNNMTLFWLLLVTSFPLLDASKKVKEADDLRALNALRVKVK